MALIDVIAYGLTDEVVADCVALEAVLFEEGLLGRNVIGVGERFAYFEVVAPACEFETIIAKCFGFDDQLCQRHIGPLTGKEGDGTCHVSILLRIA